MASTSEWQFFHQTNNNNNNHYPPSIGQVASSYTATSASDLFFSSGRASEATSVSTTVTPTSNPSSPGQGPAQLGPNGRVWKPSRRRTRASRRTPTTLLNTDTSNFRAMVQQFTGGPSNSFNPSMGQLQHGFNMGPGLSYGVQFPTVGQLQFANRSSAPSTASNVNNNNNLNTNSATSNIFMQSMGNHGTSFTSAGSNNNVNVGLLGGTGGGSSSSENISSNGFPF